MSNQAVKITMILVSILALGTGGYVWWERSQNQYRPIPSPTKCREWPSFVAQSGQCGGDRHRPAPQSRRKHGRGTQKGDSAIGVHRVD